VQEGRLVLVLNVEALTKDPARLSPSDRCWLVD
jgi:hypothetical protein